jgi:hypothetical protein
LHLAHGVANVQGVGRERERSASAVSTDGRRKKMRKIAMGLAMVMVLSVMAAGVALAGNQVIRCHGIPCVATGSDDLVFERPRNGLNDEIYLRGGDDQVRAARYRRDHDKIFGSAGFDLIYVNDGDKHDRIRGGKGDDKCFVDARSEVVAGCSVVIVD